jgi:CRISPR/Cas system CSM-associated protein Csm3 (group 7 of RAMP superfamily)
MAASQSVPASGAATNPDIVQAISAGKKRDDHRQAFHLKAEFSLDGSLLIRSGSGPRIEPDTEQTPANDPNVQRPDFIHLHSARPTPEGTHKRPVLSGTSLAGALRARAFKIARLIAPPTKEGEKAACGLIDDMFGADMKTAPKPKASRITVYEHVVSGVEEKENTSVQNRVSIDRFTGGTRDGALFNEQPLFGGTQSVVTVNLQLANPQEYEIGLLLLLLKDLWTGDLPLGGEISVGRGRLRGKKCQLEYRNGQPQSWELYANGASGLRMEKGKPQDLENYVIRLHTHLGGSKS